MNIIKHGDPEIIVKAKINFKCEACDCEFECTIRECNFRIGHDSFGNGYIYRPVSVACPDCGKLIREVKPLTEEQIADTANLGD